MTASETVEQRAEATAPVSQRRLTVGICINVVAIAFEVIAVATAMPAAARDLDGLPYYAWSFSLFVIGMLFTTVLAGRLSDRVGPAPAVVLVAQVYSVTERPRVFAFISTAWVLPSFVGPPVSAWLTEQLSWHWVFYAVVPLVVGGGLLILPTLRTLNRSWTPAEHDGNIASPAPLWAAGVVALSAAALQLAGQRLDWLALGLLVAGLAGLVVGLPRLMPACFSRIGRGLPSVILSRGLLAGAFVGAEAFVPLMLVEERGVALVLAGAALTVGSVGWTAGSWLQSRPWLKIRRDRLIALGCLSLTIGLAGTALVAFLPGLPYYLVAAAWIFAGLGMGLSVSSTGLATMTLSRDAEQGRNGSSLNLSDALGAGLFVGISGTIFAALRTSTDLSVTFAVVIGTMAVLALLATLTALRIGPVHNEFISD